MFKKIRDGLQEKIKVTNLEIIVAGTKEKPYFEIKYKEVGKEDYNIGYSSYDLNNVFNWKEERFEIVNQVEAEYKDVLSRYYHSDFERRINEVIPMLKTLHLLGTISLIKDLKAENDVLRSYLPQPPKGE